MCWGQDEIDSVFPIASNDFSKVIGNFQYLKRGYLPADIKGPCIRTMAEPLQTEVVNESIFLPVLNGLVNDTIFVADVSIKKTS